MECVKSLRVEEEGEGRSRRRGAGMAAAASKSGVCLVSRTAYGMGEEVKEGM